MLDQDGNTVALMAEDEGSLGKGIGRQLLRTHRAFTATIFSPDGEKLGPPSPVPSHVGAHQWGSNRDEIRRISVEIFKYPGLYD